MGSSISSLVQRIFSRKQVRILMLGLDAAGKTTILYKLKLGEVVTTVPTIGFNVESMKFKNVVFTVWDMGGQDRIRGLWRYYFNRAQGLIFVVDSSDRQRVAEVKSELHNMLLESELRDATLLVLANKNDLPLAMCQAELAARLGLNEIRDRRWHIQSTCATSGEGLQEAFEWLNTEITK